MKAHWIIENFTDSEDYRDLIKAVKDLGKECFVIDKRNHFDFNPASFVVNECVIVQGSIQMVKNIESRLPKNCFPIKYCTFNNYLCSVYYPKLKDFLFNDKYVLLPLKELKENKFDYYQKFGKEALIFVRPDSGEKTFQAQLLDLQDFDRFWTNSIASSTLDDDLVLVSTPKDIIGEWRFICSKYNDGEIITQSTYRYQGKLCYIPAAPVKATELCKNILKVQYYPDSVFCIDICQAGDNKFYLLELTSFSSAGLYATDKKKIATRVSEITEFEYGREIFYR
jgi:hypothetical protein